MAAAEARAAWQRTANRCFVQEDAKRAPKLACPSSTYPSSKHPEAGPANTSDGLENPVLGFIPLNRNPSYSNLPPESKWWLHIQPNYIHQMKNCEAKNEDYSEMGESYELLEMDDSIGSSTLKKVDEIGFDPESPWCGSGRSEPWWRVADKDELASLVSQRSLDLIENCDLPQPLNRSIKKDPHDFFRNQKTCVTSPMADIDGFFASDKASCEEQGLVGLDTLSRDDTIPKSSTEPFEKDPTKVQLMEALRHSQTRAREAEKAAKQANAEKEHILKLFFKQASHLFAYKQWFQLLQLENIYSHIKNTNQPLSSLFPVDRKLPRNQKKHAKARKRGRKAREPEQDFGKFAVAFALGLGLVGAGLFLGWTVAWMLPGL